MPSFSIRPLIERFTAPSVGADLPFSGGDTAPEAVTPGTSRRDFLKSVLGTCALTGAVMATGMGLPMASEALRDKESPPERTDPDSKAAPLFRENPTGGETVTEVQEEGRSEVGYGNAGLTEDALVAEVRAHPFRSWLKYGVFGPMIEEVVFRAAPDFIHRQVFPGYEGLAPKTGLASVTLFALPHAFGLRDGKPVFSLPVPQLLLGGLCWYLQRTKGYKHAALAHALNNSTMWAWAYFSK